MSGRNWGWPDVSKPIKLIETDTTEIKEIETHP